MKNNIIEKILDLLRIQGKSQKELTDFLGITQNAFTDWKSGRLKSYTKHIPSIAKFFNVSVEYLMGETDDRSPIEYSPKLSEGEEALLDLFRQIPEDKQGLVLQMIEVALKTKQ